MDPGAPDRNEVAPQGVEGSDRGLGSGAERQRYQGSTDRHSRSESDASPSANERSDGCR